LGIPQEEGSGERGAGMSQVEKSMMIFSGTSNPGMAKEIAQHLDVELGNVKITKFSNGEIYARYLESVRGADVFIIQSISGEVNDALMELLIMTDAAKRASARTVTAVITHYGYSRQDKKSAAREPITAKLVANLIEVSGVDRVIAMDLHQGQIQGFFDKPVNHLTALPFFADYFDAMGLEDACVVSPDVGRAKAAKKLSDLLDCDLAIMSKGRPAHNVAEITSVIGEVAGKNCIVNDDMIDTAGSVAAGVQALVAKGAKSVHVCATHGLFSGPAYERIESCDAIDEVVVTNTVPVPLNRQTGKIKVISVAPLFAHAIANVFNEASVSELFDPDFAL
jgi:ribose-phosphate pyrophosphokinase